MVRMINGVLMVSSKKISESTGFIPEKCKASLFSQYHKQPDFNKLAVGKMSLSGRWGSIDEIFVSLEGLKWILDHGNLFTSRKWLGVSKVIKDIFEVDYPVETNKDNVAVTIKLIEENTELKTKIKELEDSLTASKANVKTLQDTFQKAFEIIGGLPLC